MSLDPHVDKVLDRNFPYMDKSPVVGKLNCILHTRSERRQMELTAHPSRAIVEKEIHELVLTDESDVGLGKVVDRVAYLGFFETLEGGMILAGDRVEVDGAEIGHVAGFDLTHFPNHINICIRVPEPLQTGHEMGFKVGARIAFHFERPEQAGLIAM